MKFDNPEIPEGINTRGEHPLREFFWLLLAVLVTTAIIAAIVGYSAGWIAKRIPYRVEQQMAQRFFESEPTPSEIGDYLQHLADRLAPAEGLPDDMSITVHYIDDDDDVVNAFATLGGHLHFYRGLLARLPSEDALAMVIAHEIAHVKHRHPIMALGRGVTLVAAVAALSGVSGGVVADRVTDLAALTNLSFSRAQEREADVTALRALVRTYGNAAGAVALFELFAELEQDRRMPTILLTHPHSKDRSREMRERAAAQGWPTGGNTTPLPKWLTEAVARTESVQ